MKSSEENKLIENSKDKDDCTQDLIKYFNFKYAKYLAVLIITIFVFYHGYLNSFYGRNSCNRLLGEGHILGDNEWQPYGCMIHKYNKNDIETCFKYVKYYNGKNQFVFIGDFRMRQIYHSFIKQLDSSYKYNNVYNNEEFKQQTPSFNSNRGGAATKDEINNLSYSNKILNLEVHFIWKPILDESLYNLIESYLQPNSQKPSFVVMGMATSYIKMNSSKESLEWFKGNLTNLVDMIKSMSFDSKYMPPSNKQNFTADNIASRNLNNPGGNYINSGNNGAGSVSNGADSSSSSSSSSSSTSNSNSNPSDGISSSQSSSFIYWMLQDPVDEVKYSFNKTILELITNRQIDLYNRAAISILYYSPVNIWSSSRLVSQGFNKDSPDGIHIGPFALEIDSQMLFNLYCNNRMNFNDASCCSQPEQMSLIQQITFSIFIICLSLTAILFVYKNFCKSYSKFRVNISGSEISLAATCKNAASSNGFLTLLNAVSKLALIMLYFFACDRANYFMKENKHYTFLTFFIPLIYVSVVGLFFHDNLPAAKVMNRQQTDELKGFMQFVILIYRMSDAQKSTSLFLLIRLFTSSYLFLSGYGHFMYYWNNSNYSISRFFEVLFRINFLPILLCFTMNRMYQFYSFIPLVTFWFVFSYVLMVVYPRVSAKSAKENAHHYFYMIIKLCVFTGLVTTLNMSEVLFEKIFVARPWKFLFISFDDLITDWRSRWSQDCYSFIFGIAVGIIICILKRINIIDENISDMDSDSTDANESWERKRTEKSLPIHIKFGLVGFALIGIVSYISFANLCTSKENCNEFTPYITVIPVVSYIILKNTVNFFRDKCSYMFSWFGKISLELFVCSFHIWLAADSNGILVLLPGYPVLNMLITTFIFICISHELYLISKLIGKYVVPNNWRICLRNFCSFIILLMPIAIKYGYI